MLSVASPPWRATRSDRSASKFPKPISTTLRERLARTRWPDQIPGSGWGYGTDLAYLQDLCDTGRTKFDWRAQEERFNRWPHFLTEIDGQQIHFIHARSDNPDAMPLIITHGWPGSVAEFLDVIEPLRDRLPRRRAVAARLRLVGPDDRSPAGTCSASPKRGQTLMARLGYERYGAQGGDWGAMISARLAGDRPRALHRAALQHAARVPRRRERRSRSPRRRSPTSRRSASS